MSQSSAPLSKDVTEVLEHEGMRNRHPCHTSVDTEIKLGVDDILIFDLTLYCNLRGVLEYLTFTRLDLSCYVLYA